MPKKRRLSPWGTLRIKAAAKARAGKDKEAQALREKADRLEKEALEKDTTLEQRLAAKKEKKKTEKKKAKKQGKMPPVKTTKNQALAHIGKISDSLGIGPEEMVNIFLAGLKEIVHKVPTANHHDRRKEGGQVQRRGPGFSPNGCHADLRADSPG